MLIVSATSILFRPSLAQPAHAGATRAIAASPLRCQEATIEGELVAGKSFERSFGGELKLYMQPVASGWILRVLPINGLSGVHDYAELATPPYQSPNPLSISTDFAFRAQDAIAWNPRRFRFASSPGSFAILSAAYQRLSDSGAMPPSEVKAELAHQIAQASEGVLTILDARLTPGLADQWRMAEPVAQHLEQTLHTDVPPPDGRNTPLGRLLAVRFRVTLELPPNFATLDADRSVKLTPHACAAPDL